MAQAELLVKPYAFIFEDDAVRIVEVGV